MQDINDMDAHQLRHRIAQMTQEGERLAALLVIYAGNVNTDHPIDRMIAYCMHGNPGDAQNAVAGMLRAKRARLCYMCSGRGHWADKCPMRKEIDRAFRNSPFMATWSQVRGYVFN